MLYISAWAIFGVARSDWVGNAKALLSGTSDRYRFPRFLFIILFTLSGESTGKFFGRKEMKLHVGQMIKEEVERQERPIAWFARKLSCSRANVYNIFARENIDLILLIRISNILNVNFLERISQELENT